MSENKTIKKPKAKKISYSKANTYDSCGWKYYLTYEENHFVFEDSIASELGTTLHFCEETMFNMLKETGSVDYEKIKDIFQNVNIPKKDKYDVNGGIFGINILKEKYKTDFYQTDNLGRSYYSKTLDYLTSGMYRLEDYLKANPDITLFDVEKHFSFEYKGYILSGYIDRIFYDKKNDKYIIEDIKTKDKLFKDDELTTPLQFVIYCMGLNTCLDIPYEKMECYYNLPFVNATQKAGTKGFIKRGFTKLDKIIENIENKNWEPSPSPLCYWCQYSMLNPNQPEDAKNLCPYFSLWTPDDKNHAVENKWEGMDNHEKIMNKFLEKHGQIEIKKIVDEFDFDF